MSTNSLELQIFSLVAKITGHDAEELERDMFLEGNLGLDSIKMMELMNGLLQLIPPELQPKFMEVLPLQNLMQLQTLGDVVQIADKCLAPQVDNSDFNQGIPPQSESIINQNEQKTEKVEILSGQYFHLLGHWVINSISLFSTLRLQGDFNSNVAWQSWKDLLARHPMLRSRFIIPPDATRFKDYEMVVLENPTPPEIPVTDIRHLNSDAQEQLINDELHRCLNYEWQMTEWPLHRFFVFRLEDSVYQLVLANEHLISDALGCHVILREFMEIYRAHVCGEQPNLQPPTTVKDYSELVQSINAWQDPEEDKALVEYVNRRGKDSYLWNPTGSEITSLCPKFQNRRYSLGKAITNQLIAQTREWRLPLNSLLVSAFVRAVSKFEKSKNEPIMVQVPTSGRVYPGIDATDVVGSFAQNLSISLDLPAPHEDWQRLLNRVHQEIQQGLANGYDRAQTRQMAIAFRDNIVLENGKIPERMLPMYRRILKSNLYCPFTGQTNIKNKYGPIDVLDYRAGGINAAGTIDILQEIFDDCLHLFASYDSNFFPESVIDDLMQEYIAQIKELASLKIQPQQLTQPLQKTQADVNTAQILQEVATEVCHSQITDNDMAKDLETELGMDSLELIRIVTRLEKRLGKVNRQGLLSCRSLQEMAVVLGKKQSVVKNQQPLEIPYLEIIEQAQRTPNAIAVTDGETQITYEELNRLSNQVANYLQAQGVKPGVFVGIMTRRGPLMFVGILGILKAGGTYVPLDPIYPHERIKYILEHAEIGILLTENRLKNKLAECLSEELPLHTLMFLDEGIFEQGKAWTQLNKKTWTRWSDIAPANVNTPDDLMTVLYTSGSTGKPKGVMLNHQGYMNRLVWMQNAFQLRYGDRVAQKTSCCFDISVWEIFWPLMVGATVYSVETETVKNPWLLAQWIKDNQINVMHFVPSLFGEFCNALETESWTFPDLRWLVFSGEALPVPFVQRWIDRYGMSVGLANLYGPTEASIDVTAHIIRQRPGEQETCIPIGKAIDNVYILILDEQMQPVAPGQMGELWIGGVQLAKGYLKDQQRTDDAFRVNPFSHVPGKHLYKTGDLAIELPDGSFEYHGRIDHQVKIRGFRVELGEIESVLNSHPAINEAAVLAVDYENGQKRLIACLAGSKVDNQQIKEFLAQRLPDYMIPHRWEWLASLPKTHNGKLDRKAILASITQEPPRPENSKQTVSQEYLPLGPAQRWLVKYFEPPYQWNGYTRFLFHQPLDADIFDQALNVVLEHHPALRTVFVQQNQQWYQQLISPEQKLTTEFYDGSHLTSAQRDSEIHHRIQEIAQQFQIDQWPLMKVIAIKVNESCYDISLVGHHIIGDLLSTGVIFNLLWLTYSELLGNRTQSFQHLPLTPSYADYVRVLLQAEKQGALASHVDYWKSQFPSQEYTFQVPFDHQKGANLEASAASEKFTLSKKTSNILLREAKQHYKCNVYTLLLSTLYRLMAEWSGQSWVVVSHRSHGRNLDNNHTFLNSVGNFAMNFPIGVNVGHAIKWEQTTKQIQDKFNELPMNGVTFDWISEQLPKHIYPDNNLTPVRANYLGNRTAPSLELFEFIEEDRDSRLSSPDQKRTALLEFFFSITDGVVHLEIQYSRNFHVPATIRRLGDRYLELMADMLAVISLVGNGVDMKNHS